MGLFRKTGKPFNAILVKPSMKGLRLCSGTGVPAGTVLEIMVDMRQVGYPHSLLLEGEVVWSEFSGKTKREEQGVRLLPKGKDYRKWEKFILDHLKSTDRTF